jgi:hypothetical protein
MAVVQSTYTDNLPVAYAGLVANGETSERISRTVVDAGGLGFGRAAFRNGDTGCTGSIVAGVGNFLGFTIAHEALGILPGQPINQYPQFGEDITVGAQVYITAGGAIVDTVGTNTIATGWFFDTAALNGGLVRIAKR